MLFERESFVLVCISPTFVCNLKSYFEDTAIFKFRKYARGEVGRIFKDTEWDQWQKER